VGVTHLIVAIRSVAGGGGWLATDTARAVHRASPSQ
jgi:hypothetical protein